MLIIVMVFVTALIVAWLILLSRVNRDDWIAAACSKLLENLDSIEKLHLQEKNMKKIKHEFHGLANIRNLLPINRDNKKKIAKLESDNKNLKQGVLGSINILIMPGYVLVREFEVLGKGSLHKKIMTCCYELYGKKYAACRAKQLLAKLFSYPLVGVAATLILGVLFMGAGSVTAGTATLGIGTVLVLVLVYALYDELCDRVRKRRNEIRKQFPNVVSKLALLVTSGMVMDRAWKETAHSHESEIYQEMRKTSEELDNLVSPESAYGNFINRCNTKETAKLASAILQNLSKGNAEVGRLMKEMAREAWLERRHMAKRDAEKANSKLMIPTMMLFLAILIMLMVPVMMNFSGI